MEMAEEKEDKGFEEYECKRFADVLMEAEEIKSNPKKMAAAKKHLGMAKKVFSSISELKEERNKKSSEDGY